MAMQPRGFWQMPNGTPPPREPMFNLPTPIMVLGGLMIAIHVLREFVLSRSAWEEMMLTFSFIPLRYGGGLAQSYEFPGGVLGDLWTFVTYAFLHGSWMHLALNLVWMAAFATVVLRRIGTLRFAGFFVATAAAGALVHLLLHMESGSPLVGVSAVLSGAMAASARFAFSSGYGGISAFQSQHYGRCLTLAELRSNQQAMMFLGIWLALNLIFGLTSIGSGGGTIAWEAHLGGFVVGLLAFPYFDPYSRTPRKPKPPKPPEPKNRPDHLRVIK